jgi:crossover junction endodeoxyribonuclease RuvC
MTHRIIGIDPGLKITGYAVVEPTGVRCRLVEAGVFRLASVGTLGQRLQQLYQDVTELFEEHRPTSVAVEELFSHYERPKTAVIMGHARGVILLAATQRQATLASYLPTKVKRSLTGNGHASKAQIQRAIQLEFSLPDPPEPPDVADALAVALCHVQTMKTIR